RAKTAGAPRGVPAVALRLLSIAPAVAALRAVAAVAAGARAVLARLGLVDRQRPALELGAVEGADRLLAALGHLHTAHAARAARLAVHPHLGPGHGPVLGERLAEVVGRGLEREVPDVDVLAHAHPSGPQGPQSRHRDTRPIGRGRHGRTEARPACECVET